MRNGALQTKSGEDSGVPQNDGPRRPAYSIGLLRRGPETWRGTLRPPAPRRESLMGKLHWIRVRGFDRLPAPPQEPRRRVVRESTEPKDTMVAQTSQLLEWGALLPPCQAHGSLCFGDRFSVGPMVPTRVFFPACSRCPRTPCRVASSTTAPVRTLTRSETCQKANPGGEHRENGTRKITRSRGAR